MSRENQEDCIFCRISRRQSDFVAVLEDQQILAVMDLYPATPGHVLVIPRRHVETVYELDPELAGRIMTTAVSLARAIKANLSPDGLNLIQANGTAAGQTIRHFHLHLVPRYENDSVLLKFGHGNKPEKVKKLERVASLLKSALGQGEKPV